MMTILVTVFVTDDDWNRNLNFVRHRFLYMHRNMLLDVYRVWPVDGNLDWKRYWLLDRVRDVFLDWERGWYGHFDWVRYGFLNVDGHGTIDVHLDGVRYLFLDWVRYWLLDMIRHRFRNMHGVRPVDWDLYGVWDFLDYRVWGWYMYRDLYWVRYFLFDGVGSGYMDFYRDMDLFLNWVRFGHVDLYWDWSVNVYVDWVRYFLLNWVGLWYVNWYFDYLFYGVRDVFDNRVGLRDWHFNWIRNFLFDRIGYVLLDRVRYWDIFDHCDSFVDLLVPTITTEVTTVEPAVPSDVGQASLLVFLVVNRFLVVGHSHFFFCFLGFFRSSEGQDSHQTGGHEL